MSDDKKILHTVSHKPGDGHPDYLFWCPGCKCGHGVWVTGKNGVTGATWAFNGNFEKPTFSPSLKISRPMWVPPVTPENQEQWRQKPWPQTKVEFVCHSVITNGMINFCPDSTHELAGKSVPMEAF